MRSCYGAIIAGPNKNEYKLYKSIVTMCYIPFHQIYKALQLPNLFLYIAGLTTNILDKNTAEKS